MKIMCCSILPTALLAAPSLAHARQSIATQQAATFIGRQTTVCGPVVRPYYGLQSKGQPTTLNPGATFLNQNLAVLIRGSDRGKFEKPSESLYAGKQIRVTETVETHRGSPEIVVMEPGPIAVK